MVERDLWPEIRYLVSGSHFRLSASVPPSFEPQFRDNGAAEETVVVVVVMVNMNKQVS